MTAPLWAPGPQVGRSAPPVQTGPTGPHGYQQRGYPEPPMSLWENRSTFASQLGGDANLPVWTTATRRGIVPLRPLGFGDILGGAFRSVRFNPPSTLGLTLVITVGVQLLAAAGAILFATFSGLAPLQLDMASLSNLFETGTGAIGVLMAIGLFAGGSAVGSLLTSTLVSYVVCEGVAARRVPPREALLRLGRRVWATLGFGLLVMLAAGVALGGWTLLITALVMQRSGPGLAILGLLLFFGVAAALWVKLAFTIPVIAVEGLGPIAAIGRSWALTRGRFWRTFGIQALATFIVQMAASTMTQVLAIISMAVSLQYPVVSVVATLAVSLFASALTLPLLAGVTALLYTDARIRTEGLDIALAEAMAE